MEKKSNKRLVITIVVLILLLVGVSGYLVYDKMFSNEEVKTENKVEDTKKDDVEEMTLVELKNYSKIYNVVYDAIIKNPMVMHLPLNNQPDYFYRQDKIYVNEIRDDVLMSMVVSQLRFAIDDHNIIYDDVYGNRKYYFPNDYFKQAFVDLFGNYKDYTPTDFVIEGCSYKFDQTNDRYEVLCGDIGDIIASTREHELVKTIKTKDSIEVYDVVAFINHSEKKVCKDVEFKECVGTLHNYDDFNIQNYLSELNQYKYIFKLNADGNYYFYGVELVK